MKQLFLLFFIFMAFNVHARNSRIRLGLRCVKDDRYNGIKTKVFFTAFYEEYESCNIAFGPYALSCKQSSGDKHLFNMDCFEFYSRQVNGNTQNGRTVKSLQLLRKKNIKKCSDVPYPRNTYLRCRNFYNEVWHQAQHKSMFKSLPWAWLNGRKFPIIGAGTHNKFCSESTIN